MKRREDLMKWSKRGRWWTAWERIQVVNKMWLPKVWYLGGMVDLLPFVLKELNDMIMKWIHGEGRVVQMRKELLEKEEALGGLGLLNIEKELECRRMMLWSRLSR